jgi:hypothetical protein
MKKEIWFKAKRYGWGWYPSTWQGWLVLLIWAGLFIFFIKDIEKSLFLNSIGAILIMSLLIWICYKKGEQPRWRWGK